MRESLKSRVQEELVSSPFLHCPVHFKFHPILIRIEINPPFIVNRELMPPTELWEKKNISSELKITLNPETLELVAPISPIF